MLVENKNIPAEPYRVALVPELGSGLDAVFARWGMTRREGIERLAAWLIECDEVTQQLVLGIVAKELKMTAVNAMTEKFLGETSNRSPLTARRIKPLRLRKAAYKSPEKKS